MLARRFRPRRWFTKHGCVLVVTSSRSGKIARNIFFSAAAEAMRRILVDNARRKHTERHGGKAERIELDGLELATPMDDDQLLATHEALDRLAVHDATKAELVKLKFFAGLTTLGTGGEKCWIFPNRPRSVIGHTPARGCFERLEKVSAGSPSNVAARKRTC